MKFLTLLLTQSIIDELKGSTNDYRLLVWMELYSSGTGYDLLTWNGGISVGDEVNIYMVYLNDNVNRRTDFGEITFEDDIVAVGYDWRHTLWFTGSRFSLHTGNKNNGDYPRYGKANSSSKFKDRWFEPSNESDGAPVIASWTTQGTSNDWFQVADVNGNDQAPGYAGGTAMKKFRLGCNNGLKGDFFRIITKAPACNGTSFNYSSAQYCVNFPFGNPSPNLTGIIDGTFSSSVGLIFADTNSNVGSSNGIIDLSASTPGNYTITYSYGVNCTLDFDVEILGLPTVDLGNDTAICQGNPITFEPSTTLANSFLWTYDSEEPDYSGWSSQTDDTITVTSNSNVSFNTDYILTATNTCGSEDDTISVNHTI